MPQSNISIIDPISRELVILVDENDNEIGTAEKLEAHQNGGQLHRCFSIFIFNSQGQFMLQQRAMGKYHSGGLWTNTVCSHPRPNEANEDAAHRRLKEEMGFDTQLSEIFTFIYRAELNNELTEQEFDHVFLGYYDHDPYPNPEEAMAWKWIDPQELLADMDSHPNHYTPWIRIAFIKVLSHLPNQT